MAGIHIDQYITLLLQSNLVRVSELEDALKRIPPEGEASAEERLEALSKALAAAKLVTPWQDGVLRSGQPRSFFLGKFRLLNQLTQEHPLKTYLAESGAPPRKTIIKLYPIRRMRDDASFRQDVLADAKLHLTLHHPGLVRTLSVESLEPVTFQVNEYFPGKNLAEVVAEAGPLPVQAVVRIAQQAAEALAYLHARQVVHRRVRPGDLRLGPGGKIKLGGLGGWRFEEAAAVLSKAGSSEGSDLDRGLEALGAAYWAPEEFRGTGDASADLYGLGATLYFLLAGRPPFAAASPPELFEKIRTEAPPPLRPARGAVSPEFEALIGRLLAKDPADRIPTAAELLRLLGGGAMGEGGSSILARGFGAGPDVDPEPSESFSSALPESSAAFAGDAISASATSGVNASSATSGSSAVLDLAESAVDSSVAVGGSKVGRASGVAKSSRIRTAGVADAPTSGPENAESGERSAPAVEKTSPRAAVLMVGGAGLLLACVVGAVVYAAQGSRTPEETAPPQVERAKLTHDALGSHLAEWEDKSKASAAAAKEAAAKAAKAQAAKQSAVKNNPPFTPWGSLPKSIAVRSNGVVDLFNDGAEALAVLTDKKGQVSETKADYFSNGSALEIRDGEAGKAAIPGLSVRVAENTRDAGKVRYLAFAWRGEGEGPFTIEIAAKGKYQSCPKASGYFAGKANPPDKFRRFATSIPSKWTEVVLDLGAECGEFDLTGIKFKAEKGRMLVDSVNLLRYREQAIFAGAPERALQVLNESYNELKSKGSQPKGLPLLVMCGAPEELARRLDGYGFDAKSSTAVSTWPAPWTHCRTQDGGPIDGRGAPLELELAAPPGFQGKLVVFCIDASRKGRRLKILVDGNEAGLVEKFESGRRVVAAVGPESSKDGRIRLRIEPQNGENAVVSMLALFSTGK